MYDWETTLCVRCHAEVDPATSYKQAETMMMRGKRIKLVNHYCPDCARLLNMIGAGEHTAMQERAAYVAPEAPETKQD